MIDRGKQNLLGVKLDAVDNEAALERIVSAAQQRRPLGVSALAVHGVMSGVLDRDHRYRLNRLELVVPDGQPVRWGLNWLHGCGLRQRVYGPQLMLETCQAAVDHGFSLFLFGGTEELLQALRHHLLDRFPGLVIAGQRASRFRQLDAAEKQQVIEEIRDSGASVTFVGLGCPRQEVWTYEFKDALQMPVIAVGAAFTFHAGLVPQAPAWMQRCGLEWLFRLRHEPTRLWKRYLFLNPLYLALLLLQLTRLREFDPDNVSGPPAEIRYG